MQYDPSELALLEQRLRAAGFAISDVCRKAEVATTTWSRWKSGITPRPISWRRILKAADALLKTKRAA
jgi:hypothetical protein